MTWKNLLYRAEGDSGPDLFTQLEGVVLSTLTGISVEARTPEGEKLTKAIVVDDDANGLFHIVWDAGDLVPGDTAVDYVIIDAGGNVDRLPDKGSLVIRVRKKV